MHSVVLPILIPSDFARSISARCIQPQLKPQGAWSQHTSSASSLSFSACISARTCALRLPGGGPDEAVLFCCCFCSRASSLCALSSFSLSLGLPPDLPAALAMSCMQCFRVYSDHKRKSIALTSSLTLRNCFSPSELFFAKLDFESAVMLLQSEEV